MKNWDLEFYFYETAAPEERSEMRAEMYEGSEDYDEDEYYDKR